MAADVATYEASINAVPYAGRAIPHLVRYLEDTLSAVVDQHSLVLGREHEVDAGPEYDTLTVRVRFQAASEAEASAITGRAARKVGTTDKHWRVIAHTAARRTGD